MKKYIKRIDIFGKPLQLRFGKEINKTTLFGGIFSIITYILVCISLISKILEYFKRNDPGVNYRIRQSTSPNKMNLKTQNLELMFTLVDSHTFEVLNIHSYFFDIEFLYVKHFFNISNQMDKEEFDIYRKNCSELKFPENSISILTNFSKSIINNSICMGNELIQNDENIVLEGILIEKFFSHIAIKINVCNQTHRNSLKNPEKCKNITEINDIRDGSFLEIFLINLNIDYTKYDDSKKSIFNKFLL